MCCVSCMHVQGCKAFWARWNSSMLYCHFSRYVKISWPKVILGRKGFIWLIIHVPVWYCEELIVLHPPTANSREHRQMPLQACFLQPGSLSLLKQSSRLSSWRGAIHTQSWSLHLSQQSRESPIAMPTGQPDLCNSESLFSVILNSSKFRFRTKQQSWQVSCHDPHHAGTHAGLKFPHKVFRKTTGLWVWSNVKSFKLLWDTELALFHPIDCVACLLVSLRDSGGRKSLLWLMISEPC